MTEDAEGLIEDGRGAEAVTLLGALSAAGDGAASARLATLTALGAWTAKDWPRALGLLELAARQGSLEAGEQIAVLGGREGRLPPVDRLLQVPPRSALCEAPRVRQIDGFIGSALCDWLIRQADGRLARAQTVERAPGQAAAEPQERQVRTNSAFAFPPLSGGCVLALIGERIGAAVRVPPVVFEPPQVFHYAVGQAFHPHTDYFYADGASQRIATFLIYLNEGFEGGETWFPRPGLKLRPARGSALYFANVDAAGEPDPLSLHAGLAPTAGEKWLFSQWIRDRPYVG